MILWAPAACQSITNYSKPEGPLFTGNYADTPSEIPNVIKVITWNIKFSEKIDTAIAELSEVEEMQNADIILLQEMEKTGVDAIAQASNHFPARVALAIDY